MSSVVIISGSLSAKLASYVQRVEAEFVGIRSRVRLATTVGLVYLWTPEERDSRGVSAAEKHRPPALRIVAAREGPPVPDGLGADEAGTASRITLAHLEDNLCARGTRGKLNTIAVPEHADVGAGWQDLLRSLAQVSLPLIRRTNSSSETLR